MNQATEHERRMRPAIAALLLLVSALFAAATLGLLEFVAGWFVEPLTVKEIPGDAVSRTVTYLEVSPAPLVRDVELLWKNEPGARKTQPVNPAAFGRSDLWTVEINSLGYRGPERTSSDSSSDVFRILCVGDSVTFGFSVDQGQSYPDQLERLLETRYPGQRFEVINAGVPGWSWLQGLRFLDLFAADLDPDVIVIGHGTNDQLFPAKVTDEDRFLRLATPLARVMQKTALFAAETNLYRLLARGLPDKPADEETPGCKKQILEEGSCRRVSLADIEQAVHEVRLVADRIGADLLVVNSDFVETLSVRAVSKAVQADGLSFVDLVAELRSRRLAEQDERAHKLGLSPATQPAPAPADGAPQPKQALVRVLVPDPARRYTVFGQGYFNPKFTFDLDVFDDGSHGDEKARDSVFSTTIEVPANVGGIEYQFRQDKQVEFAPLPPLTSQLGNRVLQVPGSRKGPVHVFGQARYMVERAHPDKEGHSVNAELVARAISKSPRFGSSVAGADTAGN